jgi:hypothetical protein
MTRTVLGLVASALLVQGVVFAQQARHPDLSGVWSYAIDRAPAALKKEVNGQVTIQKIDQSSRHGDASTVRGVLPSTPRPSYKPELLAKLKDLADHETRTDPVFSCGTPGVPRIGPPRKVVQLAKETIFFYEDISGDPYRVIPTDGRPHRQYPNPSAYGDSIGKWEGDVFVVDVTGGEVARDLVLELRRAGLGAERAYEGRSMKSQMKQADRSGARLALIVGDDELAAGEVTVRPLAGGDQDRVPRTDVIERVRKFL